MCVCCKALWCDCLVSVVWELKICFSPSACCFSVFSRLPVISPFFAALIWTGFPVDCDANYFKCEIGPDGIFSLLQICVWSLLAPPNSAAFLVFNNLGLSPIAVLHPACVCVFARTMAVCPRSSLQLQIWRRPGHSSFAGQRPERQCLQPAGRGRRDQRGGQRHLPGAQIVSLSCH